MMDCPCCANARFTVKFQLSSYRVVRCAACGVMYNRDFPEPEALASTFSEHYYATVQREAFAHVGNPERVDASREIYALGLDLMRAPEGGRLLDIGCAFGAFLEFAASRGWSAAGVEISPYSSRYARDERNLDVLTGSVFDAPFPEGSFDAVTIWDVIEHVREVTLTLERVRRLLKPRGSVVITTDNFGGLIGLISSTMYRLTGGAVRYPVERFFIPYNSCFLTIADMRRLLDETGFSVDAVRPIDYPIEKINLSAAEKIALNALYAAGRLTGMTSQVLIVARKR